MWFGPETLAVTFRRRQVITDPSGGTTSGDYADFMTRQANVRTSTGREIVEGGQAKDSIDCIIRIRDGVLPRQITSSDRATLLGQDFDIITVGLPDRVHGSIEMTLRRQMGGQ
jgi:head-tail adaptor